MTPVLLYVMTIVCLVWSEIPSAASGCMIDACVVMMLLSWLLYGMRNLRTLRSREGKTG